jgi:hypothetical protein
MYIARFLPEEVNFQPFAVFWGEGTTSSSERFDRFKDRLRRGRCLEAKGIQKGGSVAPDLRVTVTDPVQIVEVFCSREPLGFCHDLHFVFQGRFPYRIASG